VWNNKNIKRETIVIGPDRSGTRRRINAVSTEKFTTDSVYRQEKIKPDAFRMARQRTESKEQGEKTPWF
jgi:hypothetical protein